jgi:hypothetical protein
MAAAGVLTHHALGELLGYPRELALVCGGLAAGLATWLGPIITATRRRLAAAIAPGRARS